MVSCKKNCLQGCGPKGKQGVAQHTPESVKRCEDMNPHTPREFHFGSLNFQKAIARVKTQWIEEFFISMESSWNVDI